MVIEKIFNGVNTSAFFSEYYESAPLTGSAEKAIELFDLKAQDILDLLATGSVSDRYVHRLSAGEVQVDHGFNLRSDESVTSADIQNVLNQGDSIRLFGVHRFLGNYMTLCQKVSQDLNIRANANAYISPPGKSALKPHIDGHDVIVIQLYGEKHWRLFPSNEDTVILPVHAQADGLTEQEFKNLGEPKSILLEKGQSLYLPRGHIHSATATDKPSVHITLSVGQILIKDILKHALTEDYLTHLDGRLSASGPFRSPEQISDGLLSIVDRLRTKFEDPIYVSEIRGEVFERVIGVLENQMDEQSKLVLAELGSKASQ